MNERLKKFLFWILSLLALMLFTTFVTMEIIIRSDVVKVPDLIGKNVDEAKRLLAQEGLYLIQDPREFSMKIPRGKIMKQTPAPGSKIKRNREVRVIISAGKEKVNVPNLIGKSLESAEDILKEKKLRKGLIVQTHSQKYSAGRVISQTPERGTEVEAGSAISILVSQGAVEEEFIMPDLIGKKIDKVISILERFGFKIGMIKYTNYPGLEPGLIIRQTPLSGYRVHKSNIISLEVSK